jgi:nitrite reductase/ring-hydroxylating ferredoxin subunit
MSRYPFPSYPRGWFAVALTHELGPDEVLTRKVFGQEVVLFRDSDGAASVLDPHCPHLGAHLGVGGCVKDGALQCPFHGIRFSGAGDCVSIPGDVKIPPGMKARAWDVREIDGAVLVWYDPAGAPPAFEAPSYFEKYGDEGWEPMQWHVWERLAAHPQETSENSVDLAHFSVVHGYSDFRIVEPIDISGDTLRISYTMTRDLASAGMPGQLVESVFHVRVHGLGYSVVEVETPTFNTKFRTYVLCTPIDEEHAILRGGGTMLSLPDPNMTKMVNEMFFKGFVHDVEQDFNIWENKAYLERPVLAANDGPIGQYRKWCKRFYAEPQQEAAE